jgi:hypothetical protein
MDLEQLKNLEQLSQMAVDRSQIVLEKDRQQLQLLDQHRDELSQLSRDYQQSIVGTEEVTPRMLAHRRAFVSKLTLKLSDMSEQRQNMVQTHRQRVVEHSEKNAQHSAIESVYERNSDQHDLILRQTEQRVVDDAQRSIRHQSAENREQNYD